MRAASTLIGGNAPAGTRLWAKYHSGLARGVRYRPLPGRSDATRACQSGAVHFKARPGRPVSPARAKQLIWAGNWTTWDCIMSGDSAVVSVHRSRVAGQLGCARKSASSFPVKKHDNANAEPLSISQKADSLLSELHILVPHSIYGGK